MDKMTKKLSDNFKNLFRGRIIHCETKQKSAIVLSILESLGFKWCNGDAPTSDLSREYGKQTCYRLADEVTGDRIRYGTVDFYKEDYPDCTILEFEDFIEQYTQLLIKVTGGNPE